MSTEEASLPQKKYYRQRAHSNPLADHHFEHPVAPSTAKWSELYPAHFSEETEAPLTEHAAVRFLDVGCGYGGLLVELGSMFPDHLSLGMEIRVKVSDYVKARIAALRTNSPGQYQNIAVLRMNVMKYLPTYFRAGQITKMFFLFPDPHFKKTKHKWRVINETLLAEYAYVMAEGGILYTITDVVDLHVWMASHLDKHPLFQRLTDEELAADPVIPKLYSSSEEGKKVIRNMEKGQNHGDGDVRLAVYRRIADPFQA
eukprot:m.452048 g.452048  ORF g.452048 m.452048 type:complete len:257 (-) comp56925_c0_seq4:1111-1881(-)